MRLPVSTLIVTFNSATQIEACLASVAGTTAQVVVVDNASTDGTPDLVETRFPGVEVVRMGGNVGFAPAVNVAVARAHEPYTLLLNPDAELVADALAELVADLEAHPRAGCAGPALVDPDGSVNPHSARRFPTGPWLFARLSGIRRLLPALGLPTDQLGHVCRYGGPVPALSGAALLLRTQTLRELGGLDETLPMYLEDLDLFARLGRAGLECRYVPQARVRHAGAASARVSPSAPMLQVLEDAHAPWLLARRYRGRRAAAGVAAGVAAGALVRHAGIALLRQLPVDRPDRARLDAVAGHARHLLRWAVTSKPGVTARARAAFAPPPRPYDDSPRPAPRPARIDVLGCPVDVVSLAGTVERIHDAVEAGQWMQIATANVDFVMQARRDPVFAADLHAADLVVPDGVPVTWAARLLGRPLAGRVNGTDLTLACADVSAATGRAVALVGAAPHVAAEAARVMRDRAPGAEIVAVPTPCPLDDEASRAVVAQVRDLKAAIVLVALGAPRQERWLRRFGPATGACVGIGIGSAFDIVCGARPRAPRILRDHGLEWLHRLVQEPRRLGRRYLVDDSPFVLLVAREVVLRRAQTRGNPGEEPR